MCRIAKAGRLLDWKTVRFFLKISKEIGKAWLKSLTRATRVLEYAKIRTVLQSKRVIKLISCVFKRNVSGFIASIY